jgi:hypothetical protein
MISLLRLNAVHVEKLVVKARMDRPSEGAEHYRVTLTRKTVYTSPDGRRRGLRLTVKLTPDSSAGQGQCFDEVLIQLLGHFAFAEEANEKQQAAMYPLNAVSVLLGVARGVIGQSTGMCATGTFMLPPLDVVAAAKRARLDGTCRLGPPAQPSPAGEQGGERP